MIKMLSREIGEALFDCKLAKEKLETLEGQFINTKQIIGNYDENGHILDRVFETIITNTDDKVVQSSCSVTEYVTDDKGNEIQEEEYLDTYYNVGNRILLSKCTYENIYNNGLLVSSRNTESGMETSYTYDRFNRIICITRNKSLSKTRRRLNDYTYKYQSFNLYYNEEFFLPEIIDYTEIDVETMNTCHCRYVIEYGYDSYPKRIHIEGDAPHNDEILIWGDDEIEAIKNWYDTEGCVVSKATMIFNR